MDRLFISFICLTHLLVAPLFARDGRTVQDDLIELVETHYIHPIEFATPPATIDELLAPLDAHSAWFPPVEAETIRQAANGRGVESRERTVRTRIPFPPFDAVDWLDADAKIAYLRVDCFGPETPRELRAALYHLHAAGARRLVLDLRFNSGGMLSTGVEVADMFLREGTIVEIARRGRPNEAFAADDDGEPSEAIPIMLLVNRETASAAEVVAAALQDAGRATLVGERTHGKGSLQDLFDVPGGGMLKMTTGLLRRANGALIDRAGDADGFENPHWGVRPDIQLAHALSDAEFQSLAKGWYDGDAADRLLEYATHVAP